MSMMRRRINLHLNLVSIALSGLLPTILLLLVFAGGCATWPGHPPGPSNVTTAVPGHLRRADPMPGLPMGLVVSGPANGETRQFIRQLTAAIQSELEVRHGLVVVLVRPQVAAASGGIRLADEADRSASSQIIPAAYTTMSEGGLEIPPVPPEYLPSPEGDPLNLPPAEYSLQEVSPAPSTPNSAPPAAPLPGPQPTPVVPDRVLKVEVLSFRPWTPMQATVRLTLEDSQSRMPLHQITERWPLQDDEYVIDLTQLCRDPACHGCRDILNPRDLAARIAEDASLWYLTTKPEWLLYHQENDLCVRCGREH